MSTGVRRTVKFQKAVLPFAITALACGTLALGAQKKNNAASGVLAQDKGTFTIKLDGQTVGHEQFEISPSGGGWLAKGSADIKPPEGAASKVTGELTLQSDGAPVAYQWSAHADKTNGARVVFANGVATLTLEMQGARPFDQIFTFGTPMVAVLDNNLYHQYGVLARIYDWSKGGEQEFPVLIPQELTPGSVKVFSTGTATADGQTYSGLKVKTSDLEILLLLDSAHRLMRLEVPDAKVSVVRD